MAHLNPFGLCLDSIKKNSLQHTSGKINESSKIMKPEIQHPAEKAHIPLAWGKKIQSDALAMPQSGYVPPSDRLKQEIQIQEEVRKRLRHLSEHTRPGKKKIKFQRGGSVEVFVPYVDKWPPEFVLTCQNKDRVTFYQLFPITGCLA